MNPFDSIVGHEENCNLLLSLVERGKLPHALLFTGEEGIGKLTVARALAHLVCRNSVTDDETKRSVDSLVRSGNLPDLHLLAVEPEREEITVDQVRAFCAELALKPYSTKFRVGIIEQACKLNGAAANALLKTLEEPPAATLIILVTASPQRLVETIISRCQGLSFKTLTDTELSTILNQLFPELDPKTKASLGSLCSGSLAPLMLGKFVNPLTGQLTDRNAAREQAEQRLERMRTFRSQLAVLLEPHPSSGILLSAASDGAASPEALEAFFPALLQILREGIKRGGATTNLFANGLQEAIVTETRIRERNLNPVLAVSSLLLGLIDTERQAI